MTASAGPSPAGAMAAAAISGALSLATLLELPHSNPALYHGLTTRALPLVIVAGACGVAVLALPTTHGPMACAPYPSSG